MDSVSITTIVLDDTIVVWLLYEDTGDLPLVLGQQVVEVCLISDTILLTNHLNLDTMEVSIGLYHLQCLRIYRLTDEYSILFLSSGNSHHHRLCGSCRTIVHRRIGDIHACQLCHHRLVFEDIVQCTLRNLRLIGGVACQELRATEQVGDGGRGVMVIDTSASKASELLVLTSELLEQLAHLYLAHLLRQLVITFKADLVRYLRIEVFEAFHPDFLHHHL